MSEIITRTLGRGRLSIFVAILLAVVTPSVAETPVQRPTGPAATHVEDREALVDLLAVMSGRCTTLKIAGRDFTCKAVAYAHSEEGRVKFAVALDDPTDDSHVVYFSGENGKRFDDNSYELPIDRMLLNSKDRPKVNGLPVPSAEASTGKCRQLGNFAARQVSSITCNATDTKGQTYELTFESDGKPISVRHVRQTAARPFGSRVTVIP